MQSKPSLRAVNLLFLFVLILQLANLFFTWLPQYVRLSLNEILFVFLPAYLYLRLTRRPVLERIRWKWPGWKAGILALLIGMGLYPFSAALAEVLQALLGYASFAVPEDVIPTTIGMGLLAVVAYAVLAPLCEEFLFRGVMQPVYETRGAGFAVLFVGLLFIVFHLSLLQGLSIILLTLALGYVNYRTRSLPASILTHFGANFLAALVLTQEVFARGVVEILFSPPVILGGLAASAAAFFALIRLVPRPGDMPVESLPEPTGERPAPSLMAQYWPLAVTFLIYLPIAGVEFVYSRSPELAAEPLKTGAVQWGESQVWRYEIRNIANDPVGEGECALQHDGALVDLTCTSEVRAYEVQWDGGTYLSSGGQRINDFQWQAEDGRLVSGATTLILQYGDFILESIFTQGNGGFDIRRQQGGEPEVAEFYPTEENPLSAGGDPLVVHANAWPWQLAGAELGQGEGGRVILFNQYTWRRQTQDQGPMAETVLATAGAVEEVSTPAGVFSARMLALGGDKTAWYADGAPTIVKYFDGIEYWLIK